MNSHLQTPCFRYLGATVLAVDSGAPIMELNPAYLIDEHNNKVGVQLDIETYERIEEVLENYALYQLMEETRREENNESLSLEEANKLFEQTSSDQ
jgi:hypothetical protein